MLIELRNAKKYLQQVLLIYFFSVLISYSGISSTDPCSYNFSKLKYDLFNNRITDLQASSQEWIYLTTRSGKVTDSGYPGRLHDAMQTIFNPYVENFLLGHKPDFRSMLRSLHRVTVKGLDGKSHYQGASSDRFVSIINNVVGNTNAPGKFSNEFLSRNALFDWRTEIQIDTHLKNEIPEIHSGERVPVKIAGISEKYWPSQKLGSDRIYYRYPKVAGVNDYIDSMNLDLDTAITLMKTGASKGEILNILADYLQKGVVGHLFGVGNYSIYMTQVNDLLRRIGYRGISPGNLDYHALVEDYPIFRKRFTAAVDKSGLLSP